MKELINVHNLTFSFAEQEPVLKNVNTVFPAGRVALLTGPSGCGKSTFLRLIAGLLPKYGGTVTTGKIDFNGQQPTVGMLFQDPLMQFALDTPRHELEFVLENERVPRDEIAGRVASALSFAHITELADRQLTALSGGQQQRVALAVVIARQAKILLLDEPFASIDEANRHFLIQQLDKLVNEQGITVLIADHDCHGYQQLHPLVYQVTGGQVQQLSPTNSQQFLDEADCIARQPLQTQLPSADDIAALALDEVTIGRGDEHLLSIPRLKIIEGKVTLITGPNGSGKSTFFAALARLLPYHGNISYLGTSIQDFSRRRYRQELGLVFQHANDQFLNVTVEEELALSKKNGTHPYFKDHLAAALQLLNLTGLEKRVVYSLSGGQRKKLQLLLMLMMGQSVLLMDEPFAGLDQKSLQNIFTLIHQAQKVRPQTLLVISHQLAGIDQLVDFHLCLTDHQLIYQTGGHHES